MSASASTPRKPDESELDAVIEKIDAALPKIHERAKSAKLCGKPATGAFRLANLRKTQAAFSELVEQEDDRAAVNATGKNGTHKAKAPRRTAP